MALRQNIERGVIILDCEAGDFTRSGHTNSFPSVYFFTTGTVFDQLKETTKIASLVPEAKHEASLKSAK